MSITEERKIQAIISEHYLEPLHVDKVYEIGQYKGLYLTIGTRVKITKIPAMIKQIVSLTKVHIVSFKIGKSYDLLYNTEYEAFMSYKIRRSLVNLVTEYIELSDEMLMAHLKNMKKLNRKPKTRKD